MEYQEVFNALNIDISTIDDNIDNKTPVLTNKCLDDELKIYELSKIWKEIEYNFVNFYYLDKDFDLDREYRIALSKVLKTKTLFEYYTELARFVSKLKDGHTRIIFPDSLYQDPNGELAGVLPIEIKYIENEYVITNFANSVCDIKEYSILKKINGIDIHKYIKDNYYDLFWHEIESSAMPQLINRLLRGKVGTSINLTLEYEKAQYDVSLKYINIDEYSKNKWQVKLDINRTFLTKVLDCKSFKLEKTEDNIFVFTINSFQNENLKDELYSNFNLYKDAKSFIIDIRDNCGGNSSNADCLAALFLGNKFYYTNARYSIHIGAYKAAGANCKDIISLSDSEIEKEHGKDSSFEKVKKIIEHRYYEYDKACKVISDVPGLLKQEVIILTNHNTASAAENFVVEMKQYNNTTIMGETTYGSTGNPLIIDLESGGCCMICTRHCMNMDDTEFNNIGIIPDVNCFNSLCDIKNGVDNVLLKAIEKVRIN